MEELTAGQQQELQQELMLLQGQLQQLLDATLTSSEAVDLEQPIGRLSRMDALQQQAMAKANREGHQRRLKLVEVALLALKREAYGECRSCEEPIGYRRLKARPESPFCLACQGRIEEGK